MWHCSRILLLCTLLSCRCHSIAATLSSGNTLPAEVQLGGAIVAAVEEDAEQEELQLEQRQRHQHSGLQQRADEVAAAKWAHLLQDGIQAGRGKYSKLRKQRKLLKYLYPLLVGVIVAKTILVPLTFKMLTALSASSFVMSKIALVAAGFLILKWLLAGSSIADGQTERTHFEIVQLPPPALRFHGGGWDDSSLSSSNAIMDTKAGHTRQQQQHPQHWPTYIPVGGFRNKNKSSLGMSDVSLVGGVGSNSWMQPASHSYSQHSYESALNGRPFL